MVKTIFKGIGKKQMKLTNKLTKHVNNITESINEVKSTIEAETYDVDPGDTLVAPLLLSSLKIE